MTIAMSESRPTGSRLGRAARAVSALVLLGAIVFLMGQGLPTAYSLQTQPLESACFFVMLLGLAVSTRHPLDGGVTTLIGWAGFLLATHGHGAANGVPFVLAALASIAAAVVTRRSPRPA